VSERALASSSTVSSPTSTGPARRNPGRPADDGQRGAQLVAHVVQQLPSPVGGLAGRPQPRQHLPGGHPGQHPRQQQRGATGGAGDHQRVVQLRPPQVAERGGHEDRRRSGAGDGDRDGGVADRAGAGVDGAAGGAGDIGPQRDQAAVALQPHRRRAQALAVRAPAHQHQHGLVAADGDAGEVDAEQPLHAGERPAGVGVDARVGQVAQVGDLVGQLAVDALVELAQQDLAGAQHGQQQPERQQPGLDAEDAQPGRAQGVAERGHALPGAGARGRGRVEGPQGVGHCRPCPTIGIDRCIPDSSPRRSSRVSIALQASQ
jgi:phage FluMu protein gp41